MTRPLLWAIFCGKHAPQGFAAPAAKEFKWVRRRIEGELAVGQERPAWAVTQGSLGRSRVYSSTNLNLMRRLLMEKIWNEMYDAAKAVLNERRISEYVTCGEVSAAVCSKSGKIYTGVCIDTCSTLGICAERNAIFNMITNGEQEIDKVLCILPDGSNGAPCGACRELMVQLMAGNYYDIEIMLDYSTGKTIKLGEITPEWWIK